MARVSFEILNQIVNDLDQFILTNDNWLRDYLILLSNSGWTRFEYENKLLEKINKEWDLLLNVFQDKISN